MVEWNIQSRGHACCACGTAFNDKQSYRTLLLDARGNYERQDVCESCWSAEFGHGAAARKGFVSHWQGVYEAPAVRQEVIQKATAETLLRKLTERKAPEDEAASYILAVMLERKRILKVKDQVRAEGKRIFVYEHPRTGDVFTITDPDLHLDQLDEVQRQVAYLLEHGIERVEAPAAAPGGEKGDAEAGEEPTETSACVEDELRAEPGSAG